MSYDAFEAPERDEGALHPHSATVDAVTAFTLAAAGVSAPFAAGFLVLSVLTEGAPEARVVALTVALWLPTGPLAALVAAGVWGAWHRSDGLGVSARVAGAAVGAVTTVLYALLCTLAAVVWQLLHHGPVRSDTVLAPVLLVVGLLGPLMVLVSSRVGEEQAEADAQRGVRE